MLWNGPIIVCYQIKIVTTSNEIWIDMNIFPHVIKRLKKLNTLEAYYMLYIAIDWNSFVKYKNTFKP